jgi:ABC-type amino acid transport substrate-binding protein
MRYLLALVALIVTATQPLAAAELGGTLKRIQDSGTINIGYREQEPPMSFVDADKQPVGYSIDLCSIIVDEVKRALKNPNITIKYVPVTAANRFSAVADNSIDLLCGATTKTLSRSKLVDFTQLTFVTGGSLLSLGSEKIGGIADLAGKKVAVTADTTTIEALKEAIKEAESDAEIVSVEDAAAGLKAVIAGEVAAFSSDQVVLIGLIATHKGPEELVIAQELFSFEPFALALQRNDADFRLLADRVLSQLYRSGAIMQIYERWFGGFSDEIPGLLEAMYLLNANAE